MRHPEHLYHIFPLGALRRPGGGYENLSALSRWIPHLKSLNVDTVLLGPVFRSESHGYDVTDLREVDPRLGSREDLKNLVAEFHRAGIRVVLDAVFNHTSRRHFAYLDLFAHGPRSRYAGWFRDVRWGVRNPCGDPFTVSGWAGFPELPEWNLSSPELRDELLDIARLWITDFGIDGMRLDAAESMDRGFLRCLADFCHGLKADFWMMGEVVFGDARLWLREAGLDSVTNYEGYKSLWSSFNEGNFFEIAYSLSRLSADRTGICRDDRLLLFNENHDVSRVASVLKNRAHLYPLHLMHYLLPGVPSLYYGEEWGFRGVKVKGAPDDWNLRPSVPSVPPSEIPEPDLLPCVRRFAALRRNSPALREGGYRQISVDARQIAFMRTHEAGSVLCIVNSAGEKVTLDLSLGEVGGMLRDILDPGNPSIPVGNGRVRVTVPGNWGRVFALDR